MPEHRRLRAKKRSAATPIGPKGCERHGPVFVVAAPQRWRDIAVVAASRIRGHGARNGRRWGLRPGLAGRGGVLDSTSSNPEVRKHRWVRYIADRSRRLVRSTGYVGTAQKLPKASRSSSKTSNTVINCVTCKMSVIFGNRCISLSCPPRLVTVV